MPVRNIFNSLTDVHSTRLSAHLDGPSNDKGARKVIDYSDGTEVTVERTGGPTFSNGRPIMRESRTITRTKTPVSTHTTGWTPERYRAVFGHD